MDQGTLPHVRQEKVALSILNVSDFLDPCFSLIFVPFTRKYQGGLVQIKFYSK